MKSMTGHGSGAAVGAARRVEVVAQSWNHRHLDLQVRVGESWRFLEPAVRERAGAFVRRGRCEISVRIDSPGDRPVAVRIDRAAVRALRQGAAELEAAGLIDGRLGLGDLLRTPQVVAFESAPDEWTPGDQALLDRALGDALAGLAATRAAEGAKLAEALRRTRGELGALVDDLDRRRGEIAAQAEAHLRARLNALLPGGAEALPPERLAQEVVLLIDRSDVREELDRLRGHLAHFDEIADGDGAAGKPLEFLVQELLREVNTLGAKSRDGETTRRIVGAKVLCEQLREQIQNVE